MEQGGFDCVLGNPLGRDQLNEVEYFASASPTQIWQPSGKKSMHSELPIHDMDHFCKQNVNPRAVIVHRGSPLCAHSKADTYASLQSSSESAGNKGRSGDRADGVATDNSTKAYFDAISSSGRLVSLYDFENRDALLRGCIAATNSRY